jgi:hypothetical protein
MKVNYLQKHGKVLVMGKKISYKLIKPRGCLVPPNKKHKSKKEYNRKVGKKCPQIYV